MKMRYLLFITSIIILSSVMAGCRNENTAGSNTEDNLTIEQQELPIMTMEEVKQNDGNDGTNAYIVVNGIVYDVTDSTRWREGTHNGFQAGNDLTDNILQDSPHGLRVLDNVKAIGRIE
ncbi:UNVERIFIED_CONTAM: putative heme/steroid binding protein [Acetivibrio alkalicellulosi]